MGKSKDIPPMKRRHLSMKPSFGPIMGHISHEPGDWNHALLPVTSCNYIPQKTNITTLTTPNYPNLRPWRYCRNRKNMDFFRSPLPVGTSSSIVHVSSFLTSPASSVF